MKKNLQTKAGKQKLPASLGIKPPKRYIRVVIPWKLVFLSLFCCSSLFVNANPVQDTVKQQIKDHLVKGSVFDEKGLPMPGVTVLLDSTKIGVTTDSEGAFLLRLPDPKGQLVFSFVGYKTLRVPFEAGKPITVHMKEDISKLDEVTVIAYGEQSRRNVIGAMSTVKADEIKDIPSPNLANLLQGRVAGMSVLNTSGAPGGGGTIVTIRGYNSLDVEQGSRYSNPLWVVDGVPMYSFTSPISGLNTLAEIDPNDIESIQILKDAASAAIYGSRAANGVVLLTTKKGRINQKAKVSLNFSRTFIFSPSLPDLIGGNMERKVRMEALENMQEAYFDHENNRYKYPENYLESYLNGADYNYFWNMGDGRTIPLYQDSLNPFYNNSTDLFKYYFRTAKVTDANIQVSGGASNIAYNIGLGFYDETGVLRGTGFTRVKLLSNLFITPVEKMNMNLRFYLARTGRNRSSRSQNGYNFTTGLDLERIPDELLSTSTLLPGKGTPAFDEMIKRFKGTNEKNESYRVRANFDASYEIIKGLTFKTSVAVDYSQQNLNLFQPSYLDENDESFSSGQIERAMMLLNENLLTYKHSFNEDHNIDILLGHSVQMDETNSLQGYGKRAPSDLIHYVSWFENVYDVEKSRTLKDFYSDRTKSTMIGLFGRVNYNYKQKYHASFTIRRDASSKFGKNVRWATFPSYAIGYTFSEEPFMDWARSVLDFGKIRVSYGKSGKQFDQPYISHGLLTVSSPFLGHPTVQPEWSQGLMNDKLTWEETKQFDLGLDLDFFQHEVNITVDYYHRLTDKLLYNITLPGNYSGYQRQWQNAYAIVNSGIEFMVKWDIIRKEKFTWNMSFNIARNWNRLKKSTNGMDFQNFNGVENFNNNLSVIGKALNGIYVYKDKGYYNSESEIPSYYLNGTRVYMYGSNIYQFYRPGDRVIADVDGNGQVNVLVPSQDDRVYEGSPLPKASGGITSSLSWKGFDLNVLFNFVIGRHILNAGKGASVGTRLGITLDETTKPLSAKPGDLTFWQKPGDKTNFPVNRVEKGLNNFATNLSSNVERVSFIKLKSFTLGYTVPPRIIKTTKMNIRVFFSAENVFTIDNYSGPDPERVDLTTGIDDYGSYPLAKRLTLGLTVNF